MTTPAMPPLRISVVGPIYGGSWSQAFCCAEGFKELGAAVQFVDTAVFKSALEAIERTGQPEATKAGALEGLFQAASRWARLLVETHGSDFVLALAQAPLARDDLVALKKQGVTTAMWFVEDSGLMDSWKITAPNYDAFFVIQKGRLVENLNSLGQLHAAHLPLACLPAVHHPCEPEAAELKDYRCDVSFVGCGYFNRRNMFPALLDLDFKIFGDHWSYADVLESGLHARLFEGGRTIRFEELPRIFSASKININLHSSQVVQGINPYQDFVNPRTYEIAACGAFQLSDDHPVVREMFEPGKEIETFSSVEELREKTRYYLAHEEQRKKIALAGRARALRNHTYAQRLQQMLRFVWSRFAQRMGDAKRHKHRAYALREKMASADWAGLLDGLHPAENVRVEDLARDIRGKTTPVSEAERRVLLMDALRP